MALSSSVSFAKFVAPIVSTFVEVTVFKLLRIINRSERSNNVLAEIFNDTPILVINIDLRLVQLENVLFIFVTLVQSSAGTVCNCVQFQNICDIFVTLAVSSRGTAVKLLQL